MIHLGNYEEFLILYVDNELSDEQKKLVDEFLLKHPDLQAELEMLSGAKLVPEELQMDKGTLMAHSMKLNIVDEELLLYIDNELPAEQMKVVELELKNNKDYHLQYRLLQSTRLDASEKIAYPDKKELYKREEKRIVLLAPWMRIAAAVLVIAGAGVFYFSNNTDTPVDSIVTIDQPKKPEQKDNSLPEIKAPGIEKEGNDQVTVHAPVKTKKLKKQDAVKAYPPKKNVPDLVDPVNDDVLAYNEPVQPVTKIDGKTMNNTSVPDLKTPSSVNLNNSTVTSVAYNRKTIEDAAENNNDVASNKGSVKGFLRKTTRLIEKRTGIDPTNDGELLIGAVAINLK